MKLPPCIPMFAVTIAGYSGKASGFFHAVNYWLDDNSGTFTALAGIATISVASCNLYRFWKGKK